MKKTLTAIIAAVLVAAPLSAYADSRVLDNPVNEWGWDYIDGTVDGKFLSKYNGVGVDMFVIDSGIDSTASNIKLAGAKDFTSDAGTVNENKDCLLHGNSVSSIIAGQNFGVATKVNVYSAKVFACGANSGVNSDIINALNWVYDTHTAGKPTVVNMSMRGGYDGVMLPAINKLADAGIIIVAGAGNDNQDACNYTPVAFPRTIGVGALNQQFGKADYSNYGSCVDVWAPGSTLMVKCSADPAYVCYSSGTSLAAPFVSSIVALFLENNPKASYDEVMGWLDVNSKVVDGLKHVQLPKDYLGDAKKLKAVAPVPAVDSNWATVPADNGATFTAKVVGRTISVTLSNVKKGSVYYVDVSRGLTDVAHRKVKLGKTNFVVKKPGKYTLILWYSDDGGNSMASDAPLIDIVVR